MYLATVCVFSVRVCVLVSTDDILIPFAFACDRDLVTDALLPYPESIISNHGGFLLAQSVIEPPLHMAASINVPGVVHPRQLNQSISLTAAFYWHFSLKLCGAYLAKD